MPCSDELTACYLEAIADDACTYCGCEADVIDHIIPMNVKRLRPGVSSPGNAWWNLTRACRGCNGRKYNRPLETFLRDEFARRKSVFGEDIASKWFEAMTTRFSWELQQPGAKARLSDGRVNVSQARARGVDGRFVARPIESCGSNDVDDVLAFLSTLPESASPLTSTFIGGW